MHTVQFLKASDSSRKAEYTANVEDADVVCVAYEHGNAESGEVITLLNVDGQDTTDEYGNRPMAGWDQRYSKYRRRTLRGWE